MSNSKDDFTDVSSGSNWQVGKATKAGAALGLVAAVLVLEGRQYPLYPTKTVLAPPPPTLRLGKVFTPDIPDLESYDAFGTYTITASGMLSGLLEEPTPKK